jgi:hypothetical protein
MKQATRIRARTVDAPRVQSLTPAQLPAVRGGVVFTSTPTPPPPRPSGLVDDGNGAV